jgi:hypothetical protein
MQLSPPRRAYAKSFEEIVDRFLEGRTHLDQGRKSVAKLRTGGLLAKVVGSAIVQKLAKLFPEIAGLAKAELRRRAESANFKRLFGEALEKMRAHPERVKYRKLLEELHAETSALRAKTTPRDLDPVTGANRAIDSAAFRLMEETAAVLYHSLAGSIDSYKDLVEETKVFNGIMKALYPEKYLDDFRLDAQHVLEQRAFDKWAATWKKLGWQSKSDLPAIPLHYKFHIRTPKDPGTLSQMVREEGGKFIPEKAGEGAGGLAEIARKKDIVSLTDALERAITKEQLAAMKTPDEYIAKAIDFYSTRAVTRDRQEIGAIGKDIVPVLKAIQRELDNVATLEKGFKELTK